VEVSDEVGRGQMDSRAGPHSLICRNAENWYLEVGLEEVMHRWR
jgi:hypothetical protein